MSRCVWWPSASGHAFLLRQGNRVKERQSRRPRTVALPTESPCLLYGLNMTRRFPSGFILSMIGGLAAGLIFVDPLFPDLDAKYGDLPTDFALGFGGALIAAVLYSVVALLRDPS